MRLLSLLSSLMLLLIIAPIQDQLVAQSLLEKTISKSVNDDSLVVSYKARKLLINQLEADRFDSVQTISNLLLDSLMLSEVALRSSFEIEMLCFWSQRYNRITDDVPESLESEKFQSENYWPSCLDRNLTGADHAFIIDDLEEALILAAHEHRPKMIKDIRSSNLPKQEQEFLVLYLETLLRKYLPNDSPDIQYNRVNNRAKYFLDTYPDSRYAFFVNYVLRQEYRLSDWSYGFAAGLGANRFSGPLSQEFGPQGHFWFEFESYYKKIGATLSFDIGVGGRTGDRIIRDEFLWQDSHLANSFHAELNGSYMIFESEKLRIRPFGSLGFHGLTPTQADIEDANLDDDREANLGLGHLFYPGAGVYIDYLFRIKEMPYGRFQRTFLRFKAGFRQLNWQNQYPDLGGNVAYVSVAVGMLGGKILKLGS